MFDWVLNTPRMAVSYRTCYSIWADKIIIYNFLKNLHTVFLRILHLSFFALKGAEIKKEWNCISREDEVNLLVVSKYSDFMIFIQSQKMKLFIINLINLFERYHFGLLSLVRHLMYTTLSNASCVTPYLSSLTFSSRDNFCV